MNISPVSFSGLKGAIRTDSYTEGRDHHCHTTINYYPFIDESNDEIDNFVRCYTYKKQQDTHSSYQDDNGITHYTDYGNYYDSRDVRVIERLPISKKEYQLYQSRPEELSLARRREIKEIINEIRREEDS